MHVTKHVLKTIMSQRELAQARHFREKSLATLKSTQQELELLIAADDINVRRAKNKLAQYKGCYDTALDAHITVITLEKTSADDPANEAWVRTKLDNPFKNLVVTAEEKLGDLEDEEGDRKAQAELLKEKRKVKGKLSAMEAELSADMDAIVAAMDAVEEAAWQHANHAAVSAQVQHIQHTASSTPSWPRPTWTSSRTRS